MFQSKPEVNPDEGCRSVTETLTKEMFLDVSFANWATVMNQLNEIFNCLVTILHRFKSLFSRTTWVSQYQKGKTNNNNNNNDRLTAFDPGQPG